MKKTVLFTIIALNLGSISLFAAAGSTKPTVVEKVLPTYPVACVQAGVQGRVIVEGLVTSRGELIGANAVKASDPELAAAAVQAVSQWKFSPATRDGVPTDAVIRIPVEFKLETTPEGKLVPNIIAIN